jgi:outer membrane protein TolC
MTSCSPNVAFQASEILYQGSIIKNNIQKAKLQEEVSHLNYEEDKQTIKILLLSRYFDLYKLYNQRTIYHKNIDLAQVRLKNITDLNTEGMVTKNDIIRSKLQITELNVLADEVESNIAIINKDLSIVLGLSETTVIGIDTTLSTGKLSEEKYADYLSDAYQFRSSLKSNAVKGQIAEKNIRISKGEKLPTLSLFAGNSTARPYLYTLPPQDIYFNLLQVGVKLQYNISSLYHAKAKIHLAEVQKNGQLQSSDWAKQQVEMDVYAAFAKYNEAKKQYQRREQARLLADDNYRIVEKRYLNQLALLTDILDASSSKLH